MPESEAKRNWIRENAIIFSIKLMKRTEKDIINYLAAMQADGIARGTVFKMAIREYMVNHPIETKKEE